MKQAPSHPTNPQTQPIGRPLPDWTPPPFPPHETLEGRLCRLEPLNTGLHAHDLHAANSLDAAGSNWTYLPYGPFPGLDEYRNWMQTVCQARDPQFYAVIPNATGSPAGIASYLRITPSGGSIEVGHIHFSNLLQRQPAATEALFLMMKRAFELGYRRYEWKCDALNHGSCSAAQRLGLSYEGIFRQATVYKGRNRDTAWFAAIDSEWPALQKAFLTWLDPANFDAQGQQRISLRELTQPLLARSLPNDVGVRGADL